MPKDAQSLDPALFREAADLLAAGRLVAFPTETVYGLGAHALDPAAVQRIFEAKGRPQNNPLIVHIHSVEVMARYVREVTPEAKRLAERFWPGPLTLILEAAPSIPSVVTAGGPTVALRVPDHPVALALLRTFDGPIAAPSANRSTSISPTRASHVADELGETVALILDGGATRVGLESTVLDLSSSPPRILRPGAITRSQLEEALGGPVEAGAPLESARPKSPGLAGRHYAPKTPLRIVPEGEPPTPSIVLLTRSDQVAGPRVRRLPADAAGYGAELYDALRWADKQDADAIWVEAVPSGEDWTAVQDRLRRAAARGGPKNPS